MVVAGLGVDGGVHDGNAQVAADLWGGEAHATGVAAHRLDHLIDEPPDAYG